MVPGKVVPALARRPGDISFMDPPYVMEGEYRTAGGDGRKTGDRTACGASDPGDLHGELRRVRVLRQWDNALRFYGRETGQVVKCAN